MLPLCLGAIAVLVLALAYAVAAAVAARASLRRLGERFGLGEPAGPAAPPRPGELRRAPPAALARPRRLAEYSREVDALVERALELGEFGGEPRLEGACRLALRGGKRLRAAIVLEVARAAAAAGGLPPADAAEAALAVEYLHAASLVVDDLPAFDNDAVRRGAPSVHAAAGQAAAQMAAVALVAGAFQNLCRQVDWLRANLPGRAGVDLLGTRLCAVVSGALGAAGAAKGQLRDTAGGAPTPAEVREVAELKTATLFEVAFAAGWLVGGGPPARLGAVGRAGRLFGRAFQVADDLGDREADAARGAPNFANAAGADAAYRQVAADLGEARAALEGAGLWGIVWAEDIFPAVWAMAAPPAPAPSPPAPAFQPPPT